MLALTLTQKKSPAQLVERPDPQPSPGEVIVELAAAALNRRDYWVTQGKYPGIEVPVILGSDGAGRVSTCGDGVDAAWLGRDVIIDPGLDWGDDPSAQSANYNILGMPRDGTFAPLVAVPATQLHDRPEHLSMTEAAALPLAGVTAYRALFTQGQLQSGQRILITGIGGGVAGFALQFAAAAGAEVWVTSSSSEKIRRAVALGAQGGFDYTDEAWTKKMEADAGAPNLIIDSAGGPGYASLIDIAKPGGRIVNYGATVGPPDRLDLFKMFWKQLHLVGSTMGSPEDFTAMLRFVSEKQIIPIIDSVRPLAEGAEALQQMSASPQFGKYVLSMEQDRHP
ncbi:MAG: zinc-binding dehydrogenase [Gemmatimonadetes bacterium]|jgi:zinc-binding alcohol dehydrogenase/oxidoreductase|nr:zinc-binding dehydrogenase [Gemmatimonadota bacterium]MBT6149868.1 zinc-binding dehydrogenase [Gemmatimonadota bacterium]MBT7858889.1 zinc-binding dehydrogenase [Gemmatimonadota bacterium]